MGTIPHGSLEPPDITSTLLNQAKRKAAQAADWTELKIFLWGSCLRDVSPPEETLATGRLNLDRIRDTGLAVNEFWRGRANAVPVPLSSS